MHLMGNDLIAAPAEADAQWLLGPEINIGTGVMPVNCVPYLTKTISMRRRWASAAPAAPVGPCAQSKTDI
jgi:hypothetical protein